MSEFLAPSPDDNVPEGARYLAKVLEHPHIAWDTERLKQLVGQDFNYRGFTVERCRTFNARIDASAWLLRYIARMGAEERRAEVPMWSLKRIYEQPQRRWSPEQQEVLDIVHDGLSQDDAQALNDLQRSLHVHGGPGTGKTEVNSLC